MQKSELMDQLINLIELTTRQTVAEMIKSGHIGLQLGNSYQDPPAPLKKEASADPKPKGALIPALRRAGSCRNDVRMLLRNEPGLTPREVISRLPNRPVATVRTHLSVLVRTGEAERRDGRFYYVEPF